MFTVGNIESGWEHTHPRYRSGTRGGLIIDPERREVYSFWHVGPGVPERVWHGRARLIDFGVNVTGQSLLAWIDGHRAEIDELIGEYQGNEWDGNNHVGRWTERAGDLLELLYDSRRENLETYWNADDWLDGDPAGVVDRAVQLGSVSAAVEAEVEGARGDAALDPRDVESALRNLLESREYRIEGDKIHAPA